MGRKKIQALREEAIHIFQNYGGVLRTSEAIKYGIHPRVLYELRDVGEIELLSRGVYALKELPNIEQPDFITVSKKISHGVICLVTALYFHELTVQIPRCIDVAVLQGRHPPKVDYPPVQFHWYSDSAMELGVQEHDIGGLKVKIFSPEKSIVDAFRLRKKVGLDVAIEALKNYWASGGKNLEVIIDIAKRLRIRKVIEPYIRSIIHDQS